MSTKPICPCDSSSNAPIGNLPGLAAISYRAGDFNDFRRALLTPLLADPGQSALEQSLDTWQSGADTDPSAVDLGVMLAEWWAYLSDILSFYNERIANEGYLRTAVLPETPANLIQILGYRPRPAIGAQGTLAARVTPGWQAGQSVTLPAGLQFQSKPGPGGAPQTFELATPTTIGLPDQTAAIPPPTLLANFGAYLELADEPIQAGTSAAEYSQAEEFLLSEIGTSESDGAALSGLPTLYGVLLKGSATALSGGMQLLLGAKDETVAPTLITLNSAPEEQSAAGGGKQTLLRFIASSTPPALTAANARLSKANQSAALWTANAGAIDHSGARTVVHLAGLARQIRPNDWVLFTAPSRNLSQLIRVYKVQDVFGDATAQGKPDSIPAADEHPIPVLHTELTLDGKLSSFPIFLHPSLFIVHFGWVDAGTLIDQPPAPWDGTTTQLQAIQPAQFPANAPVRILIQDSNGNGQEALGTATAKDRLTVSWPTETTLPLKPALQPPVQVYFNLLPVTRGKTIAHEILGSGDAALAGQSFKLAKSPVTYLMKGSTYASTISLTVNGHPWSEVGNFYNQGPNAQVFVTREDERQNTWVEFGDGVNGARIPTGADNVVCTYRVGAGADSPPAGKLSVVAQSFPGLQAVVNPVAVTGGSDPDPASQLKQYAPRSVLAFGRAVSVFDFQAIAAQASGVNRASAVWSWDAAQQRSGVTVYVAGDLNVATSVQALLAAAGDPNRPVAVLPAQALPVSLTLTLLVTAGMDAEAIQANVQAAFCDAERGLFSPARMAIGQSLFDSQIAATCLAVDGVLAVTAAQFAIHGIVDAAALHLPGEGEFFSLLPQDFHPTLKVSSHD